jgi:hypothetical protein
MNEKINVIDNFLGQDFPAGIPVSFITEQVKAPKSRKLMATHGEAIEKQLRKNLAGKIPDSVLNNLTFGIVMKGDLDNRQSLNAT